jgi:hypothetical protein
MGSGPFYTSSVCEWHSTSYSMHDRRGMTDRGIIHIDRQRRQKNRWMSEWMNFGYIWQRRYLGLSDTIAAKDTDWGSARYSLVLFTRGDTSSSRLQKREVVVRGESGVGCADIWAGPGLGGPYARLPALPSYASLASSSIYVHYLLLRSRDVQHQEGKGDSPTERRTTERRNAQRRTTERG